MCKNTTQNLRLDTLVPPWLDLVGPQVTTLVITDCRVAQQSTPPLPLPHIHTLHLAGIIRDPTSDEESPLVGMARQLGALPGLHELTCSVWPRSFVAPPSSLGFYGPLPRYLSGSICSGVQRIDLPDTQLCDADLESLLSMPALKEVGFNRLSISQDYSQRSCSWQQLTAGQLQVDQLPRLPLSQLQSLRLRCS